jgi:prophage regulatory protein
MSENAMSNSIFPHSTEPLVFLRLPEVERRTGFKRATIYRLIADGAFIPPVKCGTSSAWPEHEVNDWLSAKIAERDAAKGAK